MSINTPRKKARLPVNGDRPNGKTLASQDLQRQREQLPIAKGRDALVDEIRRNDVTILLGETGSGKTTQIPQYIIDSGIAGGGVVAVTQPRRVAATSLAARVAAEQDVQLGDLVGYSVRFDEVASPSTRIKYLSDGMLVRELLSDPILSRYSVIIVDEAHERTLRTDFLVANLKAILAKRNGGGGTHTVTNGQSDAKGKGKKRAVENPLKVIIMSATLDAEKFSRFFNNAKVLYVKGRQHPVQTFHTSVSQIDYVDAALRTFFQIHIDKGPGDVLIFLPGQEDIESLEKSIQSYTRRLPENCLNVLVYPMFAALPPAQQAKIFSSTPSGSRKCILATNIAETSITIPGIRYVIDTGKCKEKRYLSRDTGGGFDTLLTQDITKSSAMQRAGRAGREGPGFCFRLYTEDAFNAMAASAEPEIRRCSLTQSVLELKCLDYDLETVEFMDMPESEAIFSALKTLFLLGALDRTKALTHLGRSMAALPLEPYLARIVLASKAHACTAPVLDIVSILSASSKLFVDVSEARDAAAEARRKFRHPSGDHLTLRNALKAYEDLLEGGKDDMDVDDARDGMEVVQSSNHGQGQDGKKGSKASKAARREWCRANFLNEKTLMEAMKIRTQLRGNCERLGLDWRTEPAGASGEEAVLRCFVAGLQQQAAFLQPDGTYKQVVGQSIVKIHPGSTLGDRKAPAIIYDELIYTSQIYARGVSSVPRSFFSGMTSSTYGTT
ncbi:P-loop containing nucleoside triphosphate hydrolase protein [Coniophora puteana RWD-64-598 SS2]|uniref:RNA helicase n=1 Tax=Coniophora puteana (strain RWD-64-598) TaxID=741705 RepID=A0A5M3MB56_CONPW|nr:P-loop containing nucleoside triphosphate hydrolase protein [Coniophora puteana RWD-64-598 SS2]EIW76236.1 P-loop containing nucleoside triphosphate hydrolase protein [Coniophora puteana RWD-64-598 SS2]